MSRALKIGLPIAFLVAGIGATQVLAMLSTDVVKEEVMQAPLAVEIITVKRTAHAAMLMSTGTVQAARQVDIIPQVAGRITWQEPGLTVGDHFAKGATIARIDTRDYDAQLVQADAQVASAQLNLALEVARGKQAKRELELLGQTEDTPLLRREPQLAAIQAALSSAYAAQSTAQHNVHRTRLIAPFDAVVSSESLDIGQYVAPGSPVAHLIGTERYRVRVALQVHELRLLDIPELNATEGSTARVIQRLGDGTQLEVTGHILRSLGELDAQTRTGAVIVAIDDPIGQANGGLPILPGAYVDVELSGNASTPTMKIPRIALDAGHSVWLADSEDRLDQRDVTVGWGDAHHVYVTAGLEDGDRVVITPMALPVRGTTLDLTQTAL